MIRFLLTDCFETKKLAEKMTLFLKPKDVLLLKGDLGAGKSYFARAFLQSLLGEETDVPSPTFTLVQEYETSLGPVWHFDLYRLKNEHEVFELGIDEAFARTISLIEWPERLGSYMPKEYMCLDFSFTENPNERIATFSYTQKYEFVAEQINELFPEASTIDAKTSF